MLSVAMGALSAAAGTVALFWAVGAAIGGMAMEKHRRGAAACLLKFARLNWRKEIADRTYSVYCAVFADSSRPIAFVIRSLVAYCILTSVSLLFIWIFFHPTFLSIVFPLNYGSVSQISAWIIGWLLAAIVFVFANFQTMYFLQLMREAPSYIKFGIIAYSDIMVTASITAIGLSFVSFTYTWLIFSTSDFDVEVEVAFDQSGQPDERPYISVPLGERSYRIENAQFDIMREYAGWGSVPFATLSYDKDEEVIKYVSQAGGYKENILRPKRDQVFVTRIVSLPDRQAEISKAEQCKSFIRTEPERLQLVLFEIDRRDLKKIEDACLNSSKAILPGNAYFDTRNIDWQLTLYRDVSANVTSMAISVTTLFSIYQFSETSNFVPKARNSNADLENENFETAVSDALLSRSLTEVAGIRSGAGPLTAGFSLPLGTMQFATFFTSLLTAVALISTVLLLPLILALGVARQSRRSYKIVEFPFRTIGLILGMWLAPFSGFLYLLV